MQTTSATWKQLWAAGAALEARATIAGTVYTDIGAPVIRREAMQERMGVGNVASAALTLALRTSTSIPRSAAVAVEARLNDGTTASEWLPQGTFYIARRARNPVTGVLTLECYDALLKANAVWEPSAGAWPRTMGAVLTELLELLELSLDSRTTAPSGAAFVISEPAAGTTIRDALGLIAQAGGGNWIVTPEGKLRLAPLVDVSRAGSATADVADVAGVVGGIEAAGSSTIITGVRNTWEDAVTLTGSDSGIVVDLSIAPLIAAEVAQALIGRLYQPFSLEGAIYDPAAELGDFIRAGANREVKSALYSERATLGPAFRGSIAAPDAGEATDEYPYIGAGVRTLALAKAYATQAVQALDDGLDQQEIFDRLTDGGAAQGMVLYNGQLYINASYIKSGMLTLGGANNVNGTLKILDANGNVVGTWDNNGISATKGSFGNWYIQGSGLQYSEALTSAISVLMYVGQGGMIYRWLNSTLNEEHSVVIDDAITMVYNGELIKFEIGMDSNDEPVLTLKSSTYGTIASIDSSGALSVENPAQTRSNLGALSSAPTTVSSGSTLADYADNLQNFVFTMPTYEVRFIMTYCAASGIGPMTYGTTYAGYLCRLSPDGYFFSGLLTNNMGHTINIHRNGSGSNVTIATV